MSEHSPNPDRRYTDEELIDQELDICEQMGAVPDHATARMIASQIHGGQTSDLYSFSSTGAIPDGLMDELNSAFREFREDLVERRRIAFLAIYVAQRSSTTEGLQAVEGWSGLWLDQPNELCPCCAEDISRPHRVGCPLGTDDEPQLNRVLELQAEHGTPLLHWLNYAGFRNLEELEQRAEQFHDYYLGFFPSVEVFRQNYEVSPDAYLAQQYEIVEADGGYYIYIR